MRGVSLGVVLACACTTASEFRLERATGLAAGNDGEEREGGLSFSSLSRLLEV